MNNLISGCISKNYNKKTVLQSICFDLQLGEIYLLVGRNGIGKSTFMRIIAKKDAHYEGTLTNTLNDLSISYMPSNLLYFKYMKVIDLIEFHEKNYHINKSYCLEKMATFQINLKSKIKKLSDGQKKILGFTLSLSKEALLYLLDEPFPNVDLINNEVFRGMIIDSYNENKIFIITTHQINEFEKISSKVLVLKSKNNLVEHNTEDIRNNANQSVENFFKEDVR